MGLVKLTALDASDLEVISAHMQDAVIKLADIRLLGAKKKFVLVANRFVWEAIHTGKRQPYERRRSGLQFARVLSARSVGIGQGAENDVLCLLSISFEPAEAPAGTIVLNFAGGGMIKLAVECIEAQLDDLGPAWETAHVPSHDEGKPASAS
jgi:hypothetical protein